MKYLITLTILSLTLSLKGQTQDTTYNVAKITPTWSSIAHSPTDNSFECNFNRADTIEVVAYCLINPDKLKFKWMKLYGLSGLNNPSINFNGLMVYKTYLMHDRKTPINFKVFYSVNAK